MKIFDMINTLKAKAEAVLFAFGEAVTISELSNALEVDKKSVKSIMNELISDYNSDDRGLYIKQVNDSYILTTKEEYSETIAKLVNIPDKFKFTDALLEMLSIIAYKQPITRAEIENIRGVGCGNNLNKLIEYDLIEEKGRLETPGHPILFGTTDTFLLAFDMKNLEELPDISDEFIEQMSNESEPMSEDGQLSFGDDISL